MSFWMVHCGKRTCEFDKRNGLGAPLAVAMRCRQQALGAPLRVFGELAAASAGARPLLTGDGTVPAALLFLPCRKQCEAGVCSVYSCEGAGGEGGTAK